MNKRFAQMWHKAEKRLPMGLQVHGFTLLFNFKYSFHAASQIDACGTKFVNRREGLLVSVTKLGILVELQKSMIFYIPELCCGPQRHKQNYSIEIHNKAENDKCSYHMTPNHHYFS